MAKINKIKMDLNPGQPTALPNLGLVLVAGKLELF